jgi:hypothetical protein
VQRFFLAVLVAAALATSAALATHPSNAATTAACGIDRWTVKTLQDRPHLLPARKTTIHFLITRPAPSYLPDRRLPFEHHVFTVIAAVVLVRPEDDSDLHVVLQSGRDHMITEVPSPSCDRHASPYRRRQMRVARNHVRLCARARVTGVAFFDSTTAKPVSRRTRSSFTPYFDFGALAARRSVLKLSKLFSIEQPAGLLEAED